MISQLCIEYKIQQILVIGLAPITQLRMCVIEIVTFRSPNVK